MQVTKINNKLLCSLIAKYGYKRVKEKINLYKKLNPSVSISYWLPIALAQNFSFIKTKELKECPFCHSKILTPLGKYFYYSNVITLYECHQCSLYFTSPRIDKSVIKTHFEFTYKDIYYFERLRLPVFQQILSIILEQKIKGKILDVGAALGHFLKLCKSYGFEVIGCDISSKACDYARKNFNLEVYNKELRNINLPKEYFDFITIIDTLYYSENFYDDLSISYTLLKKGGKLILRIPNKLELIKFFLFLEKILGVRGPDTVKPIKFFNPEHIFIFSRPIIKKILKSIGFSKIKILNAIPTKSKQPLIYGFLLKLVSFLNVFNIPIMPSIIIIATK